jgi:hypothetical protein
VDLFAAISWGAYPTPGATNGERAAYAVSFGLFSDPSELVLAPGGASLSIPWFFISKLWRR